MAHSGTHSDVRLVTDLVYDDLAPDRSIDLETGQGWIDLREANLFVRPQSQLDLKLGRQILTWGTGDLIFINDLFPKDWRSFFLGRDQDYLKAPSDVFKGSVAGARLTLDLVYAPRFDPDRYLDGSRVSFFNPALGRPVGQQAPLRVAIPSEWFDDDEVHLRLHALVDSYEFAAYGYRGYWKSPASYTPTTDTWGFPRLAVYGASVQGPAGAGIGNLEAGYYESRDDRDGDDPLVRNSEFRLLAGYQQEIAPLVSLGLQYYLEQMLDHEAYLRTLPPGAATRDETRHVVTLRLGWLTLNQDLELSAFTYYSPSDQDAYVRAKARYLIDDHWSTELGVNYFTGRRDHTFFGQLENNSNIYVGIRFGFTGFAP